MGNSAKSLLDLKNKIEKKKQEKSQAEGQLSSVRESLIEEFNCKTPKQAKQKLEKWSEEINSLEEEINSDIEEIEERFMENE